MFFLPLFLPFFHPFIILLQSSFTSKLSTLCGYTSADAGRFLLFSQRSRLDSCQLLRNSSAILLIFLIFVTLSFLMFYFKTLVFFCLFTFLIVILFVVITLYPALDFLCVSVCKINAFDISGKKKGSKNVTRTLNF